MRLAFHISPFQFHYQKIYILALFVAIQLIAGSVSWCTDSMRPAIGSHIAELQFKDIRFLTRSLRDFGDQKAYVLVFSNTTCPLVQKYWPKLNRLSQEYSSREVQFVSVNVSLGDDIPDVAKQAIDYEIAFPVVKDVDGSCGRAVGVTRTPEVVILDRTRRLRYRGRIDDQYRLSGVRTDVGEDSLRRALEDVLADRSIAVAETPVDGCLITFPSIPKSNGTVAFYQDVLPLLQKHCQECHHVGGNAPFPLMSLDDAMTHADAVAEVIESRQMPPWYAHREQSFINERGLNSNERSTIISWVKSGQQPGDSKNIPPAISFNTSKWEIGTPDLITTALELHALPAEGFVDYKYVLLPYVFLEDTWIAAAEILPSNPAVVHHCNMGYVSLGKKFDENNFITGRVPGGTAMLLDDGVAFRIPKNSVIGLQVHYTTTGKVEKNRMSVGFKFPRGVVRQELRHLQVTTSRFEIPPGAAAHPVKAVRTLPVNATGIGMFSHMHLRGKDMTFRALHVDGKQETLLMIPNYHYDWQQNYRWQPGMKKFPKGTQIEVLAHFDNSRFNPFNPDPNAAVRSGPQTIHEMMFGFFFYTMDDENLNLSIDPQTGIALKK